MKLGNIFIAVAPLLIAGSMLVPLPARAAPSETPAAHPYAPHVAEAAQRFGIPADWIWQVMRTESRGKSRAVSHAGAMGLMQIMPATWKMLSTRYRLGSDAFDIRANIHGGAAYLRMMWDRYGDVTLMLAAYNAGPGRADAYVAGRRRLPTETIAYIAAITPAIGTSGVAARAAVPPSEPPSWRRAPVFALREARTTEANDSVAEAPSERSTIARPEAATALADPAPHPLFVRVSGGDE